MTMGKKDGKSLNCVIDRCLFERFEVYCEDVGQTKTTALSRILARFLEEYDRDKASSETEEK